MIPCITQQLMKSVRNSLCPFFICYEPVFLVLIPFFFFDYTCHPSPGSTVFFLLCLSLSSVSVLSLSLFLRVWWGACLLMGCWLMCVAGLQVLRTGYRRLNEKVTAHLPPQSSHTCSKHIRYIVLSINIFSNK